MVDMGPTRRATRADVAKLAQVSTAVVTYVTSGTHPVSVATRARVQSAIEELGYRPDATARALRRGRSDSIGIVLSDISNPHFMELARAIEFRLAERQHALLIADSRADEQAERSAVREMIVRGVDALLVASGSSDAAVDLVAEDGVGVPIVLLDRSVPHSRYVTIGTDSQQAASVAVGHLVEQHGHRCVGLVTGSAPDDGEPREAGWREAHAALRRAAGPVAYASWTRDGGYTAGRELLERADRPSAIFAASDLLAIGVVRAALDLGLSVPDDLAIISYDGTEEARYAASPLTSIEQPRERMAEVAVDLILSVELEPAHHGFRGPLVIRRSCGCNA